MSTTPTCKHANGRLEGERRRDSGMASAAECRQWLIWRCQLALLDAIRGRPDRTASTDDATSDRWQKYPDGGKWRGTIPKGLARLKLIRKVDVVGSARPSRHAGYVSLWQGTDDQAIDLHREYLRRLLAATPQPANEPQRPENN